MFYLSGILENDVKTRTCPSLKRDKLAHDRSDSNCVVTRLHAENQFYLLPYYNSKSSVYMPALECTRFLLWNAKALASSTKTHAI